MLGQPVNGKPFGVCEGLATAATIHEAVGIPVACAFDSGNLVEVAQALRGLYPSSPIWICGDDDRSLPYRDPPLPNVGRKKALEAAETISAQALFPGFGEEDSGSDWNDLGVAYGFETVRNQLAHLSPKENRSVGLLQPNC